MRKFIGVFVAVAMCVCLLMPATYAANDDSLSKLLEGVDISALTDDELSSILGGLNLEGVDLDSLRESFGSNGSNALDGLGDAVASIGSGSSTGSSLPFDLDGLSSLFGGVDMSWLTDIISDPSGILDMFSGAGSSGGFDINSLMDMISGAFGGAGLDIESLVGGIDLGSFDIMSILGGLMGGQGGVASGATDIIATIMDALKGGLEMLGLDTSMLDGILDNDIVNFFANLFIGVGGGSSLLGPSGSNNTGSNDSNSSVDSDNSASEEQPATPNTGDTSAVFAAMATLTVASAAAFVCLKKKD